MKRVLKVALFISMAAAIAIPSTLLAQGDSFGVVDAKLAAEEEQILQVLKNRGNEGSAKPVALTDNDAQLSEEPLKEDAPAPVVTASRITQPKSSSPEEVLNKKLEKQNKDLSNLKNAKRNLEGRVINAESTVAKLRRELKQAKEELLLAETEVERLSHIIQTRNIRGLSQMTGKKPATPIATYERNVAPRKPAVLPQPNSEEVTQQLPIATVTADKANLRTGPGLDNSVLLTVGRSSRLVIEKRQGSWYRVIAPTGERAWISGDVIHFGPQKNARPNSTIRLKGITDDAEHSAIEVARDHSDS